MNKRSLKKDTILEAVKEIGGENGMRQRRMREKIYNNIKIANIEKMAEGLLR